MDQGANPLSGAEAQQLQAEQAVRQAEAQTGTEGVSRAEQTEDPPRDKLDPRFDEDDLRQGKPPPAVRKNKHLRILRKRANKGSPLSKEEKSKARHGNSDAHEDQADLTEEEVELTDDDNGAEDEGEGKKHGLLGKILGKD